MTRPRSDLTNAELALAYELRTEGCSWKRISVGLNCDHKDLRSAVSNATRFGISGRQAPPPMFPRAIIVTAIMMRETTRFSYRSIAEHFGIASAKQLSRACRKANMLAKREGRWPDPPTWDMQL